MNLKAVGALLGVLVMLTGLAGAVGIVPGLCVAAPGHTDCGGVKYITPTFSHTVSGGGQGLQVTVKDTTPSSTGINSNFQQEWFWGDRSATGPNAWSRNAYTHTYAKSGSYTVDLTDNAGLVIGEASAVVSVGGSSGATVSISCDPSNCVQYTGSELAVEAVATPTGPFNYAWTGYPSGHASGTTDQELVLLGNTPAGSWTVTVKVTDSDTGATVGTASQAVSYDTNSTCGGTGQPKCPVQNLTVTVTCTPANCDPNVNETGVVIALSVTGSNGPFTATWSGGVPGLAPTSNGMSLKGTPTTNGTYNLTANVVNSADAHGYANVTVVVSESVVCMGICCDTPGGCPCPGADTPSCPPPLPGLPAYNPATGLLIFLGAGILVAAMVPGNVAVRVIAALALASVGLFTGFYYGGGWAPF
jgi:hypothetical protein